MSAALRRSSLAALILVSLALAGCGQARDEGGAAVDLGRFHGRDDRETFALAMEFLRQHPGTTLTVPPGTYVITSDLARETQRKVMTGAYGPKPQDTLFSRHFAYDRGISFAGQVGTTVKGRGVTLMVDGFMEPLSVRDCQGVTIDGITIDHLRKPFSQGIISAMEHDGAGACLTVTFGGAYPLHAQTPLLDRCAVYLPRSGGFEHLRPTGCTFVDAHTVTYRTATYREELLGQEFYTWHSRHFRPAILIENARDITLRGVTIHSQPGMGIVGNRSHDIDIQGLRVVPSAGTRLSTNTDATHFTSCTGRLRLDGCLFDGQGDDSLNVHAYYQSISPRSATSCTIRMEFREGTHAQTLDHPDVGDVLELTRRDSLEVTARYRVLQCTPNPGDWSADITVDHDLPDRPEEYFVADVTRLPFVTYTNNHARNHFARGVLIKTRGALIEGNTFQDVLGIGIKIAAESWWWEGVSPADVTVRRNRVINCNRQRKEAAICVMTESSQPRGTPIRNITIEDNLIDCPSSPCGILLSGVQGVTLRRNRIAGAAPPLVLRGCTEVDADTALPAGDDAPAAQHP